MASQHPYLRIVEGLKARSRKNKEILTLLHLDWPVSRYVLEQITEYITDHICADQEPVIYEIIEGALIRYSEAVHFKNGHKLDDPARFGVFLEALISETARVMEIEVKHTKGDTWKVGSKESFCQWYIDHPDIEEMEIVPSKHSSRTGVRSALYELLASDQIKNVLRRVDYEDAVLAGRLIPGP